MHQCKNKSNSNVQHLEQLVGDFFPYSQEKLGFDRPLTIIFQSDEANAQTVLGKTAFYDPEGLEIVLYVDGRHPKDIMRSLSHELVHHAQNCRGDFKTPCQTDPGYAQRDPHLRKMEREAYTKGNLIFRDYEDLIKTGKKEVDVDFSESGEPNMSLKEWKNNEINQKLMKKWGLLSESKEEVDDAEALAEDTEGEETYHYAEDEGADRKREGRLETHLAAIDHHLHGLRDDMSYDEKHERRDEKDTDFKESKDPNLQQEWDISIGSGHVEANWRNEDDDEAELLRKAKSGERGEFPAYKDPESKESGVAEGWGYRDDEEADPEKDHPVDESAVDVARSRGQLHKTIPLDDEPEESPSHDPGLSRRTKGGWESEVPKPGVKVTDPEHLARTTAKLPVAKVREGSSRKISVREAKDITRRIMERFRKEYR